MPVALSPPPLSSNAFVPCPQVVSAEQNPVLNKRIQEIQRYLSGDYWRRISEGEQVEYTITLQLLKKAAQHAYQPDVTLKPPGADSFVNWLPNGLLTDQDAKTRAYGYFYFDTQYLGLLTLESPESHCLQTSPVQIRDAQHADYTYTFTPNNVRVIRHETMTSSDLTEDLEFINPGSQEKTVSVTAGTAFNDIFQVHSHDPLKAPRLTILEKNGTTPETLKWVALKENPEQQAPLEKAPENPLTLTITTAFPLHIATQTMLPPVSTESRHDLRWTMILPPHADIRGEIVFHPANTLYSYLDHVKTLANTQLPAIHIETAPSFLCSGASMRHLEEVFQTARQDLSMLTLTIPSKDGQHTFVVPGAGIPNFVAFFGRDAIIASYFLLPFQPDYAKQTLLALAEYQGERNDAVTEEEPGKILHELRYGEMTRLGYTAHRPYYGSLDATPLFIMLYQAYADRTHDKALAAQLKPSIQRALQWMQTQTDEKTGLMKQRYFAQHSSGATGLKNIGWKDSDYAMRLISGPDGKLHDSAYPIAVAEIQAYAYDAWQIGARLFPEEQADYLNHAALLKRNFNRLFWLPRQAWPAIAVDRDNHAIPAVASNGGQVLLSDLLPPERIHAMARRIRKPDLLSGWGIRTLSSAEPAYNPISYHNGSIWPHDNALIAMGARQHHLSSVVQRISNQIFEAAETFPHYRLPELYAGLQRQSCSEHDIVPYPETSIPQAWAAASPYGLLAALIGITFQPSPLPFSHDKGIRFETPMLPTGVKAIQMDQVPLTPTQKIDIRLIRNEFGRVRIWTRTLPAQPWQVYKQ